MQLNSVMSQPYTQVLVWGITHHNLAGLCSKVANMMTLVMGQVIISVVLFHKCLCTGYSGTTKFSHNFFWKPWQSSVEMHSWKSCKHTLCQYQSEVNIRTYTILPSMATVLTSEPKQGCGKLEPARQGIYAVCIFKCGGSGVPLALVSYASCLPGWMPLLNPSGDETSHLLQILDFPLSSYDVGQFSCYLETKILSYMSIIFSCDKTACKLYIKKIKEI